MSEQVTKDDVEVQLQALTSTQLLLQCAGALLNLAALRLGLGEEQGKDLGQARQAIDGVRALLPVLEQACEARQLEQLRGSLAQLQLLYARLAGQGGCGEQKEGGARPQPGPAQRSGRLWVPGNP